jgi:nitrogen fixation protein FixH
MARLAIGTFGGEVVENSYVASQHFNRWLDEAAAEKTLGWDAEAARAGDGRVAVTLEGVPAGAVLAAVARHPLGRLPDHALAFVAQGRGRFLSDRPLPEGRWRLRLEVRAAGRLWRTEGDVQ